MDDYRNSPTMKFKIRLRMFWSKLCKSNWNCAWNLAFPVFISPIVWNMCENLHYGSVYFKELHNDKEYYWPTIYRAGAAVVSIITSFNNGLQTFSVKYFWNHIFYVHSAQYKIACVAVSLAPPTPFSFSFKRLPRRLSIKALSDQKWNGFPARPSKYTRPPLTCVPQ